MDKCMDKILNVSLPFLKRWSSAKKMLHLANKVSNKQYNNNNSNNNVINNSTQSFVDSSRQSCRCPEHSSSFDSSLFLSFQCPYQSLLKVCFFRFFFGFYFFSDRFFAADKNNTLFSFIKQAYLTTINHFLHVSFLLLLLYFNYD